MPVVHVGGSAGKGSTSTMIASILQAAGPPHRPVHLAPPADLHRARRRRRPADRARRVRRDRARARSAGPEDAPRRARRRRLRPAVARRGRVRGRHAALRRRALRRRGRRSGARRPHRLHQRLRSQARAPCSRTSSTSTASASAGRCASIAREKSAIITGGEIVVTGALQPRGAGGHRRRAARDGRHALAPRPRDPRRAIATPSRQRQRRSTCGRRAARFAGCACRCSGDHQVTNAALAVAAALAFAGATGRAVDESRGPLRTRGRAAERAAGDVCRSARSCCSTPRTTPSRRSSLARTLRAHCCADGARLHLVCGILADKDQAPMVRALAPVADRVTVTQPPLAERIGDPERMLALFRRRARRRRRRVRGRSARARSTGRSRDARRRTSSASPARCSSSAPCAGAGCRRSASSRSDRAAI